MGTKIDGFVVEVQFNDFDKYAAKAPAEAKNVVRAATFAIESGAKKRVPVDTGALKNSIASSFENDGLTGIVEASMDYAVYVEFGTGSRGDPSVPHNTAVLGQAPQPYMVPAAEEVRPLYVRAMQNVGTTK